MSIRRRNTIHDFASLRLHPDGSRVQAVLNVSTSKSKRKGSTDTNAKAQTTRLARYTTRDAQANWVAGDAGGTASIRQRRRPRTLKHEDREGKGKGKAGESDGEGQRDMDTPDDGESDDVYDLKDNRAKKRRKFYHDFSFLDTLRSGSPQLLVSERASNSQQDSETGARYPQTLLPVPSSDLLKCIHHFASEYYTAADCLYNAPKEAREIRRKRKLAKDTAKKSGQCILGDETVELSEGDRQRSDGINSSPEDTEERMKDVHDENETEHRMPRKGRRKKSEEKSRRDMYKAFDGSALMALGMLLQEHVAEMVSIEPPEEWAEHMISLEEVEKGKIRGREHYRRNSKDDGDDVDGSAGNQLAGARQDSKSSEDGGRSRLENEKDDGSSLDSSSSDSSTDDGTEVNKA